MGHVLDERAVDEPRLLGSLRAARMPPASHFKARAHLHTLGQSLDERVPRRRRERQHALARTEAQRRTEPAPFLERRKHEAPQLGVLGELGRRAAKR